MDLTEFLSKVSIWAIPVLFAITLHEVAHGWAARYFGDRTAELLGRLSLNPLRHLDPVGTVLIPGLLLAIGGPLMGWAKPVPVATRALRNPRLAMIFVALAGPAANIAMAGFWCVVLAVAVRVHGNATIIGWIALMARAGIIVNVILAVFNCCRFRRSMGAAYSRVYCRRSSAPRWSVSSPSAFISSWRSWYWSPMDRWVDCSIRPIDSSVTSSAR